MSTRSGELVAADEPTVIAKPFLDAAVVEDRESDGSFPDPSGTDESDGFEVFREINNLLDQPVASETNPWGWWGQFSPGNTTSDVRWRTGGFQNTDLT